MRALLLRSTIPGSFAGVLRRLPDTALMYYNLYRDLPDVGALSMKEPHFYCENCGNAVSLKAESCPSCGRRFDAVKCPECGFSGKPNLFSDGCPSCGYLSSLTSFSSGSRAGIVEVDLDVDPDGKRSVGKRPPETHKRGLPAWAYTIITVGLLGFLIFLLITYLTLD